MPSISGKTVLIGVIGDPIAHTFSPAMHNAAIRALDIDWCYVAFHVLPDRVQQAMDGIRGFNICGINVTVPHKQAVMPFLDEISQEALAVGAVNTIAHKEGKLIGYNTDVYGILAALRYGAGFDPLPSEVVVLGAGGAARGIVYAVASSEATERVTILNRTVEKGERLAEEMSQIAHRDRPIDITAHSIELSNIRAVLKTAGLIINATSVGMVPHIHDSVIEDASVFHQGQVLLDTVYNPRETRLMRIAQAGGARAFNGIDMLVYQGAKSFEIWTGRMPPVDVMKDAIRGQLR